MTGIIELTTTVETAQQARELARMLVEARLAACVQISGPITSVYRWQGEVCQAEEYRCTVKSHRELTGKLVETLAQHHPYETPEILVVDVADGSQAYAQWLRQQLALG